MSASNYAHWQKKRLLPENIKSVTFKALIKFLKSIKCYISIKNYINDVPYIPSREKGKTKFY